MPRREAWCAAACAVVFAVLAAACAPPRAPTVAPTIQEPGPVEEGLPADFPLAQYRAAAAAGARVYRIDSAASLAVIVVRRGGPLARFGHDHVVASRHIAGYVDLDTGRASLAVPLALLTVDEAALRDVEGLDTKPSASDIEGTRANMLGKVLEATLHPWARLELVAADPDAQPVRLDLSLGLRGVTRGLPVSARLRAEGDTLDIDGRLEVAQSAFGITPFAVMGGALRVEDGLAIRFELRAKRS
jgi:polyisoprenoid-binding protein YceI